MSYPDRIKIVCPICGKTFSEKPSHAAERVCCSKECCHIRQKQTSLGMNNNFYGKKHTPETKKIIGKKNTGTPQSIKTRKLRSEKNKKIIHTKEWREKQSASLKGRKITWSDKLSAARQGIPYDDWLGYITPLNRKIRSSKKYFDWRNAVYKRDNYCDCFSGVKGNGNLNAHHIIPFSVLLERNHILTFKEAMNCKELWDINNGVTMIDSSHAAYHQLWR
jgi:hypothetical protein